MPPGIDRAERARVLDGDGGFDAFEHTYGVRVIEPIARLWQDPHLHRRLVQGTPEWGDARDKAVTGSRVADIVGYYTFQGTSRRKVFLDYIGAGEPFERNAALDHGNKYEKCAMWRLEDVLEKESSKTVFLPFDFLVSANEPDTYAYSPDGISNDGCLAEAKCPFYREIVPGYISDNYKYGQIHYGMYCLRNVNITQCHFIEYKPPSSETVLDSEAFATLKIDYEPDWPERHLWLIEEFWSEVLAYRETATMPQHYTTERGFTTWYKKRVLDEPHRFPKSQRVTRVAPPSKKRPRDNDDDEPGLGITW